MDPVSGEVPAARPADGPGGETDVVLLRRHVAGDPEAFATLVRRHRDRLWAVALRTLGDREEAADAVQDALLSAYRGAGGYRGEAAVTTWLHRIVVNACLDRVRRRRAQPLAPLPAGRDQPAQRRDVLADAELAADVAAALATLPAEQRFAVVLVDLQGYPVDEAAAILGVPTGTVKSRCARGRVRLAVRLAHWRAPAGNRGDAGAVPPSAGAVPEPGDGGDGRDDAAR